MPIGTHIMQTVPFFLPVDKDLPEDQRPTFYARFPTAREAVKLDETFEEAVEAEGDRAVDGLLASIAVLVAGWKNLTDRQGQPLVYDKTLARLPQLERLAEKVLTLDELYQLYTSALRAVRTTEKDLGKFESPSDSDTGSSAGTADQAAA